MPRARSRWLAWFLRSNGLYAWHDPMAQCDSPAALLRTIRAHLWNHEGPLAIVDTGAIFFQRSLRQMMPTMKRAYLFRNPEDCAASVYNQTGRDKLSLMMDQSERMYRYAFDSDNNFRMYFGMIDQSLPDLWKFIAGNPMPADVDQRRNDCSGIHIDVPLSKQVPDQYKMRQLLRHKEKA